MIETLPAFQVPASLPLNPVDALLTFKTLRRDRDIFVFVLHLLHLLDFKCLNSDSPLQDT